MTAASTLVAAAAFRPLRARLQAAVDRRFDPARATPCAGSTSSSRTCGPASACPRRSSRVLRDVLDDPTLELRFLVPETGATSTRSASSGWTRPPTTVCVSRSTRWASCSATRSVIRAPRRSREVVAAGGLAVEIARLRVELRRQLHAGRGLPRADRRRRPRGAPPDRARPARRRAAAAGVRRAGAAPRAVRARVGAARAGRQDARRRGRPDHRRDRRAARAGPGAAAVAARRRARRRAARARRRARRCPSRSGRSTSGSRPAWRRPPTSSPARA